MNLFIHTNLIFRCVEYSGAGVVTGKPPRDSLISEPNLETYLPQVNYQGGAGGGSFGSPAGGGAGAGE